MNFGKMMKQAQEMQNKVARLQEELSNMEFDGSSGGGAVTVKANGDGRLLNVKVSSDVLQSGDTEMLEDLILAAANSAIDAGKDETRKRMSSLTAGMGLPGLGL